MLVGRGTVGWQPHQHCMAWRGVSHQKTEQTKPRCAGWRDMVEASTRGVLCLHLNLLKSEARTLDCVVGVNANADTYKRVLTDY